MTSQKKLPFKDYTTVNCQDAIALSSPDMYRYFVLSLTAKRDRTTDTTLKQLAGFVGEKESAYHGGGSKDKKKQSLNDRFRASGVFEDITLDRGSSSSSRSRNVYVFKKARKGEYRRVTKEFRDLSLPVKLKGYLLQLFCMAEPGSFSIKKTVNGIARSLHMANKTVERYNKELVDEKLLRVTGEGFELNLPGFFILDEASYKEEREREEAWAFMEVI